MYAFVSHTYNPMKGECEHSCAYCFMRRKLLLPPLRLELKELKVNLGKGNFIFVGSSTDEWAANVPSEWIEQILDYCDGFDNKYLFQSKNPARFLKYLEHPVMKKSVQQHPENYIEQTAKLGAMMMNVHYEACPHLHL